MMRFWSTLFSRFFPLVSRDRAIEIVRTHCALGTDPIYCYPKAPGRCHAYGLPHDIPCWYFVVPWNDGKFLIRSSRLVAISRLTGEILYDGSASDEG